MYAMINNFHLGLEIPMAVTSASYRVERRLLPEEVKREVGASASPSAKLLRPMQPIAPKATRSCCVKGWERHPSTISLVRDVQATLSCSDRAWERASDCAVQ